VYTYFVNNKLQAVGGHYTGRILVAEAVGTGLFAFGVAAAIYQRLSTAVTATVAGLSLTLGIIAASSASIGLLNPAVALGVKAWVWGTYVLGPVIGAVVGVNLYGMLFAENGTAKSSVAASAPAVSAAKKPATRKKTSRAKK
jgi:glycerol uptake facilitator-like aquaporin